MSLTSDKQTFSQMIAAAREILDGMDKTGWSAQQIAIVSGAHYRLRHVLRTIRTLKPGDSL